MPRQQRPERLEASVDALHAAALVAVGDLAPDALFCLHRLAAGARVLFAAVNGVRDDLV